MLLYIPLIQQTQQELQRTQQELQRAQQELQQTQQELQRLQELVKTMEDDHQYQVHCTNVNCVITPLSLAIVYSFYF